MKDVKVRYAKYNPRPGGRPVERLMVKIPEDVLSAAGHIWKILPNHIGFQLLLDNDLGVLRLLRMVTPGFGVRMPYNSKGHATVEFHSDSSPFIKGLLGDRNHRARRRDH